MPWLSVCFARVGVFLTAWALTLEPQSSLEVWGLHFFLWDDLLALVAPLRDSVQTASVSEKMLLFFLPLSIVISVIEEMLFVLSFPNVPINYSHLTYWRRLTLFLDEELVYNMVIFWCAFFLFRGMGYYERYREHERTAAQLEIQLANAQISALRMQLNPHFLFNTMNSISSLMRVDVDAADAMLEQLSSLMRITLERGGTRSSSPYETKWNSLKPTWTMQARRYAGRIEQIDQHLILNCTTRLVPSMMPAAHRQRYAYIHGLIKGGTLGEAETSTCERSGANMQMRRHRIAGSGPKGRHDRRCQSGHAVGIVEYLEHRSEAAPWRVTLHSRLTELDFTQRSGHGHRIPLQYSPATTVRLP